MEKSKRHISENWEEIKAELRRIEWTSLVELRSYTKIILISMTLFGFSIYAADLLIRFSLERLEWVVKLLVG